MANLLLVDENGRRRVQMELAAAARGHKLYSAGSVQEAARLIGIYVPEAVIAPDGLANGIAEWLQQTGDAKLLRSIIVTAAQLPSNSTTVVRAGSPSVTALLDAAEKAIETQIGV